MEKTELLNKIFDSLVEDIQSEKEDLIMSIEKNKYNVEKYKKCSRIKTIVAHLFFMAILKNSPSNADFINEKHPFIEYVRWNSVIVKPIDKSITLFSKHAEKCLSQRIQLHEIKKQAKKLFWTSLDNLDAAKCLKYNNFFCQAVHYSQMAAEIGIKSVLKAQNIEHNLWKFEHSIIYLGNHTKCANESFFRLCKDLENLGLKEWQNTMFEKSSTLSIRSRYCDYDEHAFLHVSTLPYNVFNSKLAKKATALCEKILFLCEKMLEKN